MSLTTITAGLTEMADGSQRWFGDVLVKRCALDDSLYFVYLGGGERPGEGRALDLATTAEVIQREQGDTKEFPQVPLDGGDEEFLGHA